MTRYRPERDTKRRKEQERVEDAVLFDVFETADRLDRKDEVEEALRFFAAKSSSTASGVVESGDAECGDVESGDAESGNAESGDAERGDAASGVVAECRVR